MVEEMQEITLSHELPADAAEPLPFPFNQRSYCKFEPIEQRIESARVLVINDLLRDERDISVLARSEWGKNTAANLQRERDISKLALENILNNVRRLVREPETRVAHYSEITLVAEQFRPQAIVLSGTLSDFDFYNPAHLESFADFIRRTKTPVLAICGGHQLVSLSLGSQIRTLDNLPQDAKRTNRVYEYQYRFIKIVEPDDPIFNGIDDAHSGIWQDYTKEAGILRVWQNHGLQVVGLPPGFKLLATAYLCKNQMMVKRSEDQLIYTVQFHLEKSFEDWHKNRTRWEHPNESRDGRIIFENFLVEALKHCQELAAN
jgi:GMP synthase-like glutamine amidotransferase